MENFSKIDLSVIAPCYNESNNVIELSERLLKTFEKGGISGEVILVNDGSRDNTWDLIKQLSEKYQNVLGVNHETNQGIAAGWKSGLNKAKGKYVCLIDADLQNLPEDVLRLYQEIKFSNADLVQGVRTHIGHLSKSRYILSRGLNFFLNYIFYTRDYYLLPVLRLFSKKVIWEAHDLPRRTNKYINIFKSCFKIITITEYLKNTLMDFGVDSGKVLTCPDGVDLSEFDIQFDQNECREKLNLPLDKNIILYAGHLYPWKGVYTLAKASQLLSEKEVVVFVGGTNFDRENFDRYIAEKNIKQDFLIIDHQPHSEIPFWLKAADVLVLPNSAKKDISKYYTSPLKLFEYLAVKKPIVASDLPSIRSILNNANALLVEPDSPSALANGIRKLIGNKQFSDGLAERSNQDVLQYTWANRVKNIISFIKN